MKKTGKLILKYLITLAVCFGLIYAFVFCGLSDLFESDDPIQIELGFSVILAFFVTSFLEIISSLKNKIEDLDKRIESIEKRDE